MPNEPKDELAIQHIISRIELIQGSPTYHTTLDTNNIVRNFKNPLKAPDDKFPLINITSSPRADYIRNAANQAGRDWGRLPDIQVNTNIEIFLAVIGEDSYLQLLRLRDDITRCLSNDFTLGGNVRDWYPVSWEAGYAWETQSRYMGTAIYTIRIVWTFRKATP
ncbi:hypothetical protein H8E77_24975 [bacterium]|nr:hypothetical protein [bacterium]